MELTEEAPYREMVAGQSDEQIDTWAADLFVDFAKRLGVGTVARIVGRLPATALQWHFGRATRIFQQLDRGEPDRGPEHIDQTGDKQRHALALGWR